jgi:hypothetical protein
MSALFYDVNTGYFYAIDDPVNSDEMLVVHVYDWERSAVNSAVDGQPTYPITLPLGSFTEAIINPDSNMVMVYHKLDDFSTYILGATQGSHDISAVLISTEFDDITLSPGGGVYGVDSSKGDMAEFLPLTWQYNLQFTNLNSPSAIAYNGDVGDEYLVIAGEFVKVYDMSSGVISSEEVVSFGLDFTPNDMIAGPSGYTYLVGNGGNLAILSANPWVGPIAVNQADAADGDILSLDFIVDIDSDYSVYLNGDRAGSGDLLVSGTTLKNATEVVDVVVEGWLEGTNFLYILAVDPFTGLTGHGRIEVVVDNPPGAVVLTDSNIGFADGALSLSFAGIVDADLDYYEIYVSDAPFLAEDYSDGGPGEPIAIDAVGGESISYTIEDLVNNVTYYIGVRAIDEKGTPGPMSNVITGIPQPAFTATDLAGETGGLACSSSGAGGLAGGLALGLGLVGMLGRRGRSVAAAALVAGLMAPQAADAVNPFIPDASPAWGNFEVRYGWVTFVDENINDVYMYGDHQGNMLHLEGGPQIFRFIEIDFGVGFLQEIAYKPAADGTRSGEKTMMSWIPLSLDISGRLHFWDEQPIVPYVRYGGDYVFWWELDDDGSGGKNRVAGSKAGHHFGFGGSLLIDLLAPRRASQLEAVSGINDTYVTVEWRRQWIGKQSEGLDFSADLLTVGLKIDY